MTSKTTTTTTEPDATTQTGDDATDFRPITLDSQAAVDSFLGEAKQRARATEAKKYADYDQLKAKAAELDSIQRASMTQEQKDAERIRNLETQLAAKDQAIADAERDGLRREIAAAKGVPHDRITGTTREELESSADELLAWRGTQARKQAPVMPAGGSGAGTTTTIEDKKERAAAMLRELYRGRR